MRKEHPSHLNIFIGYAQEGQKNAKTLETYLSCLEQSDLAIWHREKVGCEEEAA